MVTRRTLSGQATLRHAAAVFGVLAIALLALLPIAADPGTTARVSVDSSGNEGNNHSVGPATPRAVVYNVRARVGHAIWGCGHEASHIWRSTSAEHRGMR